MTRTLITVALCATTLAAAPLAATAAPTTITLGDFSGDEDVLTFDGISAGTEITTQYTGVTFSGGLYGNTADAHFYGTASGGTIATNFGSSCRTITATFDDTVHRVGVDAITNAPDDTKLQIKAYDGGILVTSGTITFGTDLTPDFVGVEDLDGFDAVVMSAVGGSNSCLGLNDFRFEVADSDGDGVPDHEDDCPYEDPADYYGYDVTEDGCMSDLVNAGGCPLAAAVRDDDTDFDNMADRWGLLAVNDATMSGGASEGTLRVFGDGDLYNFNVGTSPIDADYSYAGLGDLYARSGNFNHDVRADNVNVDGTVSIGGSTSTAAAGGHIARYMKALSQDMYNHPTNGDTTVQSWGTVEFEGDHPMMNTFRVSAADFGASTYMTIDIPEGSTAVINVTGDPATFGPTGVTLSTGVDASDVVYNFYEAHDLELDGVSIEGQVVAPWADVDLVSGDITGTLTGLNLDGTITHYNGAFDGRACAEVEAKAAPICTVTHTVTGTWPGGYNANVVITNSGSGASSWSAGWTFAGGESVSSGWGGSYSQSGADVSITNASWNGALGTGSSVTIGYTGSGTPASLTDLAASCE